MDFVSPRLRQEPRNFVELIAVPSLWRGLAVSRDRSDPLKAEYERVASRLERGASPSDIPEIAEWLDRRLIWRAKARA